MKIYDVKDGHRQGKDIINYIGPECKCGKGCRRDTCPKNKKSWREKKD